MQNKIRFKMDLKKKTEMFEDLLGALIHYKIFHKEVLAQRNLIVKLTNLIRY